MTDHSQIARTSEPSTAKPLLLRVAVAFRRRGGQRSERSPHAGKFLAVTGTLVGLAGGAIVVAIAILTSTTNRTATTVSWSAWSPPDGGTLGALEIADHVAPLYRISAVDQLAVVTVVNLASPSAAAAAQSAAAATGTGTSSGLQVAVKPNPASSAVSLLGGNTIAFNLCGIAGPNCAIAGPASTNRLLLLRREALELALYTFKYLGGVQNVVAILPPGRTQQVSTLTRQLPTSIVGSTHRVDIAVLFVRQELRPWLTLPLADTLPEVFPPTIAQMPSAPEAGLVDQITARGLFSEQLQGAQDGSNLIVLEPLPPQ